MRYNLNETAQELIARAARAEVAARRGLTLEQAETELESALLAAISGELAHFWGERPDLQGDIAAYFADQFLAPFYADASYGRR